MARCPWAVWQPYVFGGTYTGGPWKIVHHTTESGSTVGSIHELHVKHVEAHFVVDSHNVWQLIDTKYPARSLRNKPGGVQTNRDHAIQIEMVGFAGKPKDHMTLVVMRKLLRWIELEHGVPRIWPNGYPKPPKNGKDPGGHNRNALYWATKGGHYGHSQVPENIHWDPAYSESEVDFLMTVEPVKEVPIA